MNDIQELVERFGKCTDVVSEAVSGATREELQRPPALGKWSGAQILAHLADTELVISTRLRQVLSEKHPGLVPFDQNAWAEALHYSDRDPAESLATFQSLRKANHALLKGRPPYAFERTGTHPEFGVLSIRQMLETHCQHVERHAAQIQAARAAFKLCGASS